MFRVFASVIIITMSLIGSIRLQDVWGESGVVATVTPFLSTRAQHQASPCNVGLTAIDSPSLTMLKPGGARIKTREKPKPTPDFLPSELHDQHENVGINVAAASEGRVGQTTATPKMPETIALRYVSNVGSDADDGLSWGTAKHTIYGALVSLPGGGKNMAGSGTVYVGQNSLANPTAGAGIWLMAPGDPNYSSPPAGWIKCNSCSLDIIGIANTLGGPNAHTPKASVIGGSTSDNNHPGLWIAGNAWPLRFQNLSFAAAGRGIVLGECSNHLRDNTCNTTVVTFENVAAYVPQTSTAGPCTDLAGWVYWVWFHDFGCSGTGSTAAGGYLSNQAASILMDGTLGHGIGLVYINDSNLDNGGIKFIPGDTGGSLYATNVIQEGCCGPIPPTVWFTSWPNAGMLAVLNSITMADNPNVVPVIENDGANGAGGPVVINSGSVQGQAIVLRPGYQFSGSTLDFMVSPLRQHQTGFYGNYMVGETDVARRIGALVPARFTNRAYANPTSWTYTNVVGTQTLATGLTDPFGGTGAASISSSSATNETISMGVPLSITPTAGDWLVEGVWVKGSWPPNYAYFQSTCAGYGFPTTSASYFNGGLQAGDGQWQYIWTASKMAGGSGSTHVCIGGIFNSGVTPTLYGPTMFYIPSGTLSDNEVLEFASSMNSVDPSCQPGQICNVTGHPVVVSSYGTLSNCSSIASPAKCDSAPAGSFVLEVGSTTARVHTTAVTANSQILIIEDSSLGAKLGVSCNRTTGRTYMITDRAPGLSFTISSSFAPTDHPACLSFQLLN